MRKSSVHSFDTDIKNKTNKSIQMQNIILFLFICVASHTSLSKDFEFQYLNEKNFIIFGENSENQSKVIKI